MGVGCGWREEEEEEEEEDVDEDEGLVIAVVVGYEAVLHTYSITAVVRHRWWPGSFYKVPAIGGGPTTGSPFCCWVACGLWPVACSLTSGRPPEANISSRATTCSFFSPLGLPLLTFVSPQFPLHSGFTSRGNSWVRFPPTATY
ncbi:hypothetical protein TgHK011_005338 [Trichoderma gracile]|nr:hypothetical protein TgHK011_005338 [Trichoderma gracile]